MTLGDDVILKVEDLKAFYLKDEQIVRSVNGVSFELKRGESLGLFGESGSGKSTIALIIMGLFDIIARDMDTPESKRLWGLRDMVRKGELHPSDVDEDIPGIEGHVRFKGKDIVNMDEEDHRQFIGGDITHIPQGLAHALNPALSLGAQALDTIRKHRAHWSEAEIGERILKILDLIDMDEKQLTGIKAANLSVGEAQRILTAMALLSKPSVVIADEPVSSVDTTIRRWILDAINVAEKEMELSFLILSNDRGVIAETCEKVAVMSSGYIMEYGDVTTILKSPGHPFSLAYLMAYPTMEMMREMREKGVRLRGIKGPPPSPMRLPTGCVFHTRCEFAKSICSEDVPEYREIDKGHYLRCHRYEEL